MAELQENTQEKEIDSSISVKEILTLSLRKWYWFVISLVVVLGIAYIKILTTNPQYVQSATILIKETSQGRSIPKNMSASSFSDLGMIRTNTNIVNEKLTLHSSYLMSEVVRRLNLEMNYYGKGRFHHTILYGSNLPVNVKMLDYDRGGSMKLLINPDGSLQITDFKSKLISKSDRKLKVDGMLNDTLATPLGNIVVVPTAVFATVEAPMEIDVVKTSMFSAVTHYLRCLSVSQVDENASVISMKVRDVSRSRAQDILATLINAYNEDWVRDRNQVTVSTSTFIADRLHIIDNDLGNIDSDISNYKSQNLLPDVATVASMYMNEAQDAKKSVTELNNQLYMARYIQNYLNNEANRNMLLPMVSGVEDLNIQPQVAAYNSLMLERNQIASSSSASNPLVVQRDQDLDEMRNALIASVDNSIVAITAQIKSLEAVGHSANSKIASNPDQAKYLLSVERQQKVKENLYLYLLQKREENELSQAFTAYNTRVIEEPSGSPLPVSPNRNKILMFAFIVGLLIPLGIIYLKELTNNVVRGRKDIQNLPMPFIGEIPQAGKFVKLPFGIRTHKSIKLERGAVVVKPGSRNTINEAFRVVRTNLDFMLGSEANAVVAITSANPGSGKTFISFNLADSYAIKGKKTLVIDLDMRVAALSSYAKEPKKGIADYLADKVDDIKSLIVKGASDTKVDVLPVGTTPPNPTELLMSPRLAEGIALLRNEYDIIFLDCPPVEIVADASIITKLADKTIFVIRAGLFQLDMLQEVADFHNSGRYANLCTLLNGTKSVAGKYGYHYGYHYGYNYGGYGSDD